MIYIKTILKYILKKIVLIQINIVPKNNPQLHSPFRVFYGGGFPGNKGGPRVKIQRLQNYFSNMNFNFNLLYILSNSHYLSKKSFSLSKKKNIPIILNQNGVYYSGWYEGNWKEMNNKMSIAYHNADYVFWQSKFCRKSADKFLGLRNGKGEVLYNAVDTNTFYPKKNRKDKYLLKLLVTGRVKGKNFYRIENIIRAADLLKKQNLNFKIDFYGLIDKKNHKRAIKIMSDLNLQDNVNFLGGYIQKNAPKIYRIYDIYLIMNYMDPCPNTVIEAMSSGLPIIFSATGGLKELVGQRAGLGLEVRESWNGEPVSPLPKQIADAISTVSISLVLMSKASRERALKKFNINLWINRHKVIFKMLLERVL